MGSLLSREQRQEEEGQDEAWQRRANAGPYQQGDYYDGGGGLALDTAAYGHVQYPIADLPQQQYSDQQALQAPAGMVTFTKAEVTLTRVKAVYCSGPHRNAESTKVYKKDIDLQEQKRMSDVNVSVHYFERGNYEGFKVQKIKRWTQYTFNERRLYRLGRRSSDYVDVVTLFDSKNKGYALEITWLEFVENFSPFNEQESQQGQRGYYFRDSSWTVNFANTKPTRLEDPPQPRRESRRGDGRYYDDDHRGGGRSRR